MPTNFQVRKKPYTWRSLCVAALAAGMLAMGVFRHDKSAIVIAAVYACTVPQLYIAPLKQQLAQAGQARIYRRIAGVTYTGLALVGVAILVLLFGIGWSVRPRTLVDHPFLYNGIHVHTAGRVLAGGGTCTLEPGREAQAGSAADQQPKVEIWLSSASPLCAGTAARDVRAAVSGDFIVLPASKHLISPYGLTGANITVQGHGGATSDD